MKVIEGIIDEHARQDLRRRGRQYSLDTFCKSPTIAVTGLALIYTAGGGGRGKEGAATRLT